MRNYLNLKKDPWVTSSGDYLRHSKHQAFPSPNFTNILLTYLTAPHTTTPYAGGFRLIVLYSTNGGRRCHTPNELLKTAVRLLGACRIVDRRPDGCLIVEAEGKRYFVDYEGSVFREIKIEELRKYYAHSKPKSVTKHKK